MFVFSDGSPLSELESETQRGEALEHIIALMQRHHIALADIQTRLEAAGTSAPPASRLLVTVLSYIGGIFIFAGIAIFIGLQWQGLNSAARVIITLGPGVSAFAMAMIALRDERYQRLAMPLLLISAVLQPTGMMVAFAEYASGNDAEVAACVTASTFAVQYGFTLKRWQASLMAWLTVFFASAAFGFAMDLAGLSSNAIALALGLGWLSLGTATVSGPHTMLSAQLYVIGCWAALAGLFDLVEGSWAEVAFVAAVCALVYLGVWARSRALNLATTIAFLAYTAYFTSRYFAESIGWPIALILIGLSMLGISAAALQIDRNYLRRT